MAPIATNADVHAPLFCLTMEWPTTGPQGYTKGKYLPGARPAHARPAPTACTARYLCNKYPISSSKFIPT